MTAYSDLSTIERHLGVTFTGGQAERAQAALDAATAWVDRYTGRSWQGGVGVIETHALITDRVWLYQTPVTAITTVTRRAVYRGSTVQTLVLADDDYELLDATHGILLIGGYYGDRVTVTYTAAGTVPAPVKLATTLLTAKLANPVMNQELAAAREAGVRRVQVGFGELLVDFAAEAESASGSLAVIPAEVKALLAPYRSAAQVFA